MTNTKLTATMTVFHAIEGEKDGVFTIKLDNPAPAGGLLVDFNTLGSSAVLNTDFKLLAGENVTDLTDNTFTIKAGESTASLTVQTLTDKFVEGDEKVNLNLTNLNVVNGESNNTVSFADKVDYATGYLPNSISTGDFNHDGLLDLVVTNLLGDNVSVLLRNTTNTGFNAKVDYYTGYYPISVSAGDFNNDGKLDLAVVNQGYDYIGSGVSVLLRNTDNTGFDTKVDYATGFNPQSVSTGDFNNDGKLDLVTANYDDNTVSILLRNADNTGFDTKVDYPAGFNPQSVSTGDFNNDGKLDLVTANADDNTVSVLLRNADNTGFDARVDYPTGSYPMSISTGDFNNDGKLDLVTANADDNTVSVLLRNSTNTSFDDKVDYITVLYPRAVSTGDFNNDGKLDLVTANANDDTISVLLRNSINTGFDDKVDYITGSYPRAVGTGDFNNDSRIDLVTVNYDDSKVSVLLNTAQSLIITDANINHAPTGELIIVGDALQGKTLTLNNTLVDSDGLGDMNYQWFENGYPIDGATEKSYALNASNVNNTLSVTATYIDGQNSIETITSQETAPVGIELHGDDDTLVGSLSNDRLYGEAGDDKLSGEAGNDSLDGGEGNDALMGGGGDDILNGGNGTDWGQYWNVSANTRIDLNLIDSQNTESAGNDTLINIENLNGSQFDDALLGNTANNALYGNEGNDTLTGGEGNDAILGSSGDDILNGGNGTDWAHYWDSSEGINIDLNISESQNTLGAGNDTLIAIENLSGSKFDDVLIGNTVNNALYGNEGNDTLTGGEGNDALSGGNGDDKLNGGNGIDWAHYWNASAGVNIDLNITDSQNTLGAGNDTLIAIENLNGSKFDDVLIGNTVDNALYGNSGNDTLNGGDGNDALSGGGGDDILNGGNGTDWGQYWNASAGISINLNLIDSQNTLGAGNDTLMNIENLNGSKFDDILTGNAADNVLYGNGGNDTLNGVTGYDKLMGGEGHDVFVLNNLLAVNNVKIIDFSVNDDSLQLNSNVFSELNTGLLDSTEFKIGTVATDNNDYLIYNNNNGALFYDADANGSHDAIQIATLGINLTLSHADFIVI